MKFDAKMRRLITGGRDKFILTLNGTIKIWNVNNGQLLQELLKEDQTEITGIEV
jgi:hypothetical protein